MTCIVWTPQSMAADKQCNNHGTLMTVTKIYPYNHPVLGLAALAIAGDAGWGMAVLDWFRQGADPTTYPQKDFDYKSRLVVGGKNFLFDFQETGYPIPYEDKYMAFGSGQDAALGALYMGATARQAVEAAIATQNCCGRGVDEVIF